MSEGSSPEGPAPTGKHTNRWRRLPEFARQWDWRSKLRWFAAEYLIVVLGVLTAVGINAWWQSRQDAASELSYLALIGRDLDQMVDNLEELAEFEEKRFHDGEIAYRVLSLSAPTDDDKAQGSKALAALIARRTVNTTDATYKDLLSTGGLRLIRNRELRQRIVAFHEEAQRRFDIHNKNNAVFVDGLYIREIIGRGLVSNWAGSQIATRSRPDEQLGDLFSSGYAVEPARLWSLLPTADEWAVVRSVLLQRIRAAAYSREFAEQALADARTLRQAIAEAVGR